MQFGLGLGQAAFGVQVGIVACVQFNHRRADAGRGFDLARIVANKHRHPRACGFERGYEMGQTVFIACHIKPAFGGALGALFGHKADGVGSGGKCYRLHLIRSGAFEIQRDAKARFQCGDVAVADMAAVFTQVGGDAIRTGRFSQKGGAQGIGPSRATRVAHGGHMVNVHAKA